MKKFIICAAMVVVGTLAASAQTEKGGIDAEMLSRIS